MRRPSEVQRRTPPPPVHQRSGALFRPSTALAPPPVAKAANVTQRVNERLVERKRATSVRRRRSVAVKVAWMAIAALVTWLFLLSPIFALDPAKVEIHGQAERAVVLAAVAPFEGRSLVTVDTAAITAQIVADPAVREAVVERVWPDGLRVTVIPRVAVAAVPEPDGTFSVVDADGFVMARVATAPTAVPVVIVPVGEQNVRVLSAVLAVLDAIPAELVERIGGISADTEDSVSFLLRGGPRVEWGSGEDSALKAEVLLVMLQSDAASADVIDVSAPTFPITRNE